MSHDLGTSVPIQRRPDPATVDQLHHDLLTVHGLLIHKQHVAEGYADTGDVHSRDHWRAVAGAHRADAELVARALGIGETAA